MDTLEDRVQVWSETVSGHELAVNRFVSIGEE